MLSNQDIILRTLKHEGGYSNNPKDKGGETYCGISRVANPTWLGWFLLDKQKDKKQCYNDGFLIGDVVAFYENKYFKKMGLSAINNPDVKACIFDFCVNSGGAIKVIQAMLKAKYGANIFADGIFGSQMAYVINSIPNQSQLNNDIVDARIKYIQQLVKNGSLSVIFLNGIVNRAESYRLFTASAPIKSLLEYIISFLKRIFA